MFSENLSFLFLDEVIYIISEEIFYKYRKRERGKESSSFLPCNPKRVSKWGPRVGHSPQYMGWVRMHRDLGTWPKVPVEVPVLL